MLAALAAAATTSWAGKVTAWALAVVVIGLVAVSRLYLGTHWLTDVLGGLALGAAWLFALLTSVRTIDHLREHPRDRALPAGPERDDAAAPTRSTQARRSPANGGSHG